MEPDRKQLAQLLPLMPVLAELGRTEHVTETAELLGLPQSTVSRAVARASAAVGTELLVRDGRGVRLTPAARTLLPYIEPDSLFRGASGLGAEPIMSVGH